MIDEYEYARRRQLLLSQRWRSGRLAIATLGGLMLLILNLITVVNLLTGR